MAFNINEFQATLNKNGLLARPNLFMLKINPPIWYLNEGFLTENGSDILYDIRFFCPTVNMPSLSLNTLEVRKAAIGPMGKRPFGIQYSPLQASFYIDGDHKVLSFFHRWMKEIYNYDIDGNPLENLGSFGVRQYVMTYYKNFVAPSVEIIFYSPNSGTETDGTVEKYYKIVLYNAFPSSVGEVSLSWAENNSLAYLPITIEYEEIDMVQGFTDEVVSSSLAGVGLFERLFQIGSVIQVGRTIERPRSIQDAINTFTTVNTVASTLRI